MIDKPAITKTQHYVWRVDGRTGREEHRFIDAWNVIGFGGELLHGGWDAGCNVRSGRAYCPSKSQARAFIAGWGWAAEYGITDSADDMLKTWKAADAWCKTNKIGINLEYECRTAYEAGVAKRVSGIKRAAKAAHEEEMK